MSQENVEVVRRCYEAFARGDTESLAALAREHLDPGFEYRSQLAGETFRGVGLAIDWRITIVWTFDGDGRAVSGRSFSSRADSLEAAGPRE